jgi:glycosyltransferase involved in cell wall biosynthesis
MVRACVILPTYNRASVLPRAIDSVLAQTFSDFELIVVDDASEDDTPQVVSRYNDPRIQYLRHDTNRGASTARNTGLEASNSEYIFFLDSDDAWDASKMRKQIDYLEEHPKELVAVHCGFTEEDVTLKNKFKRHIRPLLGSEISNVREGQKKVIEHLLSLRFRLGGASTLLVRRDVVNVMDGFDGRFPRHQDWEFLIRVLRHGQLGYVDEPLVYKYETGTPSADTYREAKELFIETFDDDISRLDIDRDMVIAAHQHALAKRYFREGRFSLGTEYLRSSSRIPREHPSILFSVIQGLLYKGSELNPIRRS